ncbi:hypothetical protein BO70DRAFT_385759 [Aspergillus heteromorphus CBS 117.55]|uniref:Bromodomain associated domain-containing protein n=1 Tax=Aspergillus heteromorphus CBS 117.55 TaxID=1448321 RepID=A0A317WLU3_9EURO|nr:uncharacterized protein BO70DRAFT_385759 [Aspergillus heteromorphus CBS 117.55]PWY87466.1 hypothetical protein BO70DRAFT_385759 [Aspergillus heteromorphus CBS 117.55]
MVSSEPAIKRSSSSLAAGPDAPDAKRIKRPYHHHHRLHTPVNPALPEPAIVDAACIDHVLRHSIGQYLVECGFEIAEPAALDAFRRVTEEYLLKFASYVRQSMLSSRRVQPIPQDFELALKRQSVPVDDLILHLKPHPNIEPLPTLLPSPPPEKDYFKSLPSLGLSGEEDRVRTAHIPKHFPEFPSKHTYRHTPVFTEREQDPRKIRERATEDGRHGEEALRKLARAAFKDNQSGSSGRDKKQWGKRAESMDSMFEKTVKGMAKRVQKASTAVPGAAMEIDAGAGADTEVKPSRSKLSLSIELPPIVNCERDYWRRPPMSGSRRTEETKPPAAKAKPEMSRVDSWTVELASAAAPLLSSSFSLAIRIGSHAVVSTVNPPAHLSQGPRINPPSEQPHNRRTIHHPRRRDTRLRRIARLDRAAFAVLRLEVLAHHVYVLREGFGGEDGDEGRHGGFLLHDLRGLHHGSGPGSALRSRLGVPVLDDLLDVFTSPSTAQSVLEGDLLPSQRGEGDAHATAYTPSVIARAEPVVEISSTLSAAGKSHLLYYTAAVAVLPSIYDGYELGGRDSAVVFFDTDGRFDAERLRTVLRAIVMTRMNTQVGNVPGDSLAGENLEDMILACLQHVHIFRPQSSSSLLATLQHLDTYLLDLTRHHSSTRPLHSIFIDSANAFFWQDKLEDEIARVGDIGRPAADVERERLQGQSFYILDLYAEWAEELKRLQRLFSCAVIYTTIVQGRSTTAYSSSVYQPSGPYDLYTPGPSVPRTPSFRAALPAPWGTFPTLRIIVQRDAVRPFPSTMTLQDAQRAAPQRQEIISRGRFTGWVNGWGREEWPRRVLEGLEEINGGKFFFRIGREGVDIG